MRLNEIKEGKLYPEEDIAILLRGIGIRAFNIFCPHRGVPLDAFGVVVGDNIICQAHNFSFSLMIGIPLPEGPRWPRMQTFEVLLEGDQIYLYN